MLKRDTRVQIFILEAGKYILLKHHDIKRDLYFWGVPGGGRELGETDEEAAVREAYEETGLKIKLLPIKIEGVPQIKTSMYKRAVTFLAYPVEGEAKIGFDPEPELKQYYELVDIKWKDFYDNDNLDIITFNDITPFRNMVNSNNFIERKEFVVCKTKNNVKSYLLIYNEESHEFSFIPQENKTMSKYKENLEYIINGNLGFFLSENNRILYKTDIIYIETGEDEDISIKDIGKWFKYEELSQIKVGRICEKIIEKLEKMT